MKINLGDKVRDTVTGFTGIATGRTNWLQGCTRVGVQTQELHDGKPIESQWFDEPQLEVIEKGAIASQKTEEPPGGPRENPSRQKDPTR